MDLHRVTRMHACMSQVIAYYWVIDEYCSMTVTGWSQIALSRVMVRSLAGSSPSGHTSKIKWLCIIYLTFKCLVFSCSRHVTFCVGSNRCVGWTKRSANGPPPYLLPSRNPSFPPSFLPVAIKLNALQFRHALVVHAPRLPVTCHRHAEPSFTRMTGQPDRRLLGVIQPCPQCIGLM